MRAILHTLRKRLRPAWLLFGAATLAGTPARSEGVALTFDDLPIYGPLEPIETAEATTKALLAGLVRHHLPATGFVNEIQLANADGDRRTKLLAQWLDAGMDLGNHSYSHPSLNKIPVDAYIADVARGDRVTSTLLAARGRRERWYRYPFLETGTTADARQRFEGWLAGHGYRVASVTMENSDWQFADRYDEALARNDLNAARRVQAEYLAYTDRAVTWYRAAGLDLLGRRPAFVFLLHASRLNAASIDQLAGILRRRHLRAVTLDTAMKDPAYAIADTYVGPNGDEWLSRWSLTLHKDLPWASFPQVPQDIAKDAP